MNKGISTKWKMSFISMLLLISLVSIPFFGMVEEAEAVEIVNDNNVRTYKDLDFENLETFGYRPRYPYPGSPFIQTPSPMPEDAIYPPDHSIYGTSDTAPTRATWDEYYSDDVLTVYVDVDSTAGGQLSSNEKQLLDRIISDFVNFSFPRVKDYYDPLDIVDSAEFYVHQIDGASGTGGYYQPGTDVFHVDRADLSWAGVITAHEFEHYVHRQYDAYERLWVDEGSADYAAYLVYGITSATAGHVYAYLEYRPYYGLVVTDQTFYQDGSTAYYGNAYLYQMYMAHHYGGKNYTRALVKQNSRGTSGMNAALSSLGSSDNFLESFQKWIVATRLNSEDVGSGEYVYPHQTYPYGQIRSKITKSHSGVPTVASRELNGYSITTLRFSSPPSGSETYRLKMTFSAGTPVVGFYPETSSNKNVTFLDFGGSKSITYDFSGWGSNYNSFQLILSSTSLASVDYDLDVLDLAPPNTTAGISPRDPDGINDWFVSTPKVTLRSESGAFIKFQIDGGDVSDYVDSVYIEDGEHRFTYWALDRHNNIEDKHHLDFKVDTQFPTSEITVDPSLPEGEWYTTNPYITLSTDHTGSILEYKWGNDDFQPYSGQFQALEGTHSLYWRAVDQAGNQEEVRSMSFWVDTLLPHLDHVIYPTEPNGENGWYISTPQVSLTSMDAAAIYYAFDNADYQLYSQPIEVPEGEVTLRITCVDVAGNNGNESRLKFKVDTKEPEIFGQFAGFEYTPENSSTWLNHPPILEILTSESDMIVNYSINDGEAKEYENQFEIPEGPNEIWVHGKDRAGNQAISLFYVVKVDKRVPFVEHTFTERSQNGWFLGPRAAVELSPLDEDERSSIVRIYYRWGTENPSLFKTNIDILEGINTLTYWAEDLSGNEMEPRSIQLKKDSTTPLLFLDIDGLENGTIKAGRNFTVDLTGSSDESGISGYSIDYYGTDTPSWSVEGVFENFFSEPGTYEVKVYVKDAAGNVINQSFTVEVKEVEKPSTPASSNSNSGLMMVLLIVGAVMVILMIVLVIVVVVKRAKPAQTPHPPMHPGLGQRPMIHHGHLQHIDQKRLPPGIDMPPAPPKPPISPIPPPL